MPSEVVSMQFALTAPGRDALKESTGAVWTTYLFSVSALASKIPCFRSSSTRVLFDSISAGVGRLVEMGGVTPSSLWLVDIMD